jgi:hypothetical protein
MRITLTPLVVLTWIFESARSQWVPATNKIPDQVLALSPDGTVAIGSTGIYTQASGLWTLSQSLSFQYKDVNGRPTLVSVEFLHIDGSVFAVSNYSYTLGSYINVCKSTSPGIWTVSSTIYATNFGYDISVVSIILQAVTIDGNTLIVKFASDLLVLQNNGTDFVLKQKMDTSFNYVSLSDDGSILAAYSGSVLSIFTLTSDGLYELTEEHSGFQWQRMALSSNGQIILGSFSSGNLLEPSWVHFFTRIEGQYRFMSAVNLAIGSGTCNLCISSDASIVFFGQSYGVIYVLKQMSATSWIQVQNLSDPYPPTPSINRNFDIQSYCSSDGSTLLAVSSTYNYTAGGDSKYSADIFTAPAPSASSTPTSSATSSSSATATSSATSSSSATATSTSNSGSSLSSSTLQQPATIAISVLSTALTLISVALFAKWLSNYRMNSMLRPEGNLKQSETLSLLRAS